MGSIPEPAKKSGADELELGARGQTGQIDELAGARLRSIIVLLARNHQSLVYEQWQAARWEPCPGPARRACNGFLAARQLHQLARLPLCQSES